MRMPRVFRSLEEAARGFAPSAVTIGNFDGVHAGHRELMRRTVRMSRALGVKPSALTFHPHPRTIVAPDQAPLLLTTPDERCALMGAEGIEQVLVMPFHLGVASLAPEDFFRRILIDALGARGVVVGDNFHFGRRQSGQPTDLRSLGALLGVKVEVAPLERRRGIAVSSSQIRRLLISGDVAKAGRLLERPYSIAGTVVAGDGRGSRETVPTLNLETHSLEDSTSALPATGVYVTRTFDLDGERSWPAVTNIGFRPTFEGRHLTIETFLLGEVGDGAPERIRIEFLRRLRPELRFESAEALRTQILRDVARARLFFHRLGACVKRNTTPGRRP